ncbi:AraC-type DNA-binding protein [Paenibacillus algorifonticola]|uniref:AraC-type DNA-binding protein n=2 Tax=Paenibacillus algorifonticola TaxID=684063 RepID=A0A1I1Y3J0_9BACL|nr:AraC family transcriptional regulator [Paenibacillus algorifonticola]SFE12380.1 AraC-type DNA-binding protein [Paenibacillus algorifonticola]
MMAATFIPPILGQCISEAIVPDVKTTINLFGMHLRKVSGEWDYPVHTHPQYEINYVLEGEQLFIVNDRHYIQQAGALMFLQPGASHASKSGNGKPFTYFCLHFDIDDRMFLSLLSRLDSVLFGANSNVVQQLRPALNKVIEMSSQLAEHSAAKLTERMRLQSAVFELFGQLWEALSAEADLHSAVSYEKVQLAHQIRNKLQGLIYQQFKQDAAALNQHYGIDDIAAELGISVSHCNRVFRQVFEISPRVFLSSEMLHEAKVLLNDPQMSISQISAILGYRDISHFSRQFKRWYGASPSEYRRSNEEKNITAAAMDEKKS